MATAVNQLGRVRAADRFAQLRLNFNFWKLLAWLILIALCVLWVVPFLWMVSTALKMPREMFSTDWVPQRLIEYLAAGQFGRFFEESLQNFSDAFSYGDWPRFAMNTTIITFWSVVGKVLSTALVAYSFAMLRWRGRDTVFALVLATMMLPGVVTMIPQFILFSKLPAFGFQGSQTWVNTFLPLTIPAFTGDAFFIFLLRQFMRGIPIELVEAAKIDGASELRTWWSVVLPQTKAALAAVAIFTFQHTWEDFIGPLLYLQSENLYTLQIALRQFEHAAGGSPLWTQLMAASLVVILPVVIVFVLFQRFFIEGVTLTGMGGR